MRFSLRLAISNEYQNQLFLELNIPNKQTFRYYIKFKYFKDGEYVYIVQFPKKSKATVSLVAKSRTHTK